MMASPLIATNDIRTMNDAAKSILLNEEIIAINQDALGKQADKVNPTDALNIFIKPLANGDIAVAFLNRNKNEQIVEIDFKSLGLQDKYTMRDLWAHKIIGTGTKWKGTLLSHETKVLRLQKK
jgi:alpha-galactosidase